MENEGSQKEHVWFGQAYLVVILYFKSGKNYMHNDPQG